MDVRIVVMHPADPMLNLHGCVACLIRRELHGIPWCSRHSGSHPFCWRDLVRPVYFDATAAVMMLCYGETALHLEPLDSPLPFPGFALPELLLYPFGVLSLSRVDRWAAPRVLVVPVGPLEGRRPLKPMLPWVPVVGLSGELEERSLPPPLLVV